MVLKQQVQNQGGTEPQAGSSLRGSWEATIWMMLGPPPIPPSLGVHTHTHAHFLCWCLPVPGQLVGQR